MSETSIDALETWMEEYRAKDAIEAAERAKTRERMTVGQLMELLSKADPNDSVVLPGYEGNENDVSEVVIGSIKVNQNGAWYYGAHDFCPRDRDVEGHENAVLIR